MLHSLELEWIRSIHQFRFPFIDNFFKALNFFDRQEFFFILIPIIWLGVGWKSGLKMFYILLISSLVNYALKGLFLSARPFHIDPSLAIIQIGGWGFPSGAAQTAVLLSGLLLKSWHSPWKWTLAFCYFALLSFSRVYLGVHFFSDILGGWFVGFMLLAIYLHLFPKIEKSLMHIRPFFLFLISQAVPLCLLVFFYSVSTIQICSAAMGLGLGLFISHARQILSVYPKEKRSLRVFVGIFGTFVCYKVTLLFPFLHSGICQFFKFLFLGLWLGLGSHFVCHALNLMQKK